MLQPGQPSTAYARFTKLYKELVGEHCRPDHNRNREFDRGLEILKRTCECGNDKMLLPNGKLGSTWPRVRRLGHAATAPANGETKDNNATPPTWGDMKSGDTPAGTAVLPQIRVYAGVAE